MEADDSSSVKTARGMFNGAQVILDATSCSWQEEELVRWTWELTDNLLSIRLRGSDGGDERRVVVQRRSGSR